MLKKVIVVLLTICILIACSFPVFAENTDISAIAKKISKNPSAGNFTNNELIALFECINNSEGMKINVEEIAKWVKAYKTVEATAFSIAVHEETHVFTYGEKNCTRYYKNAEVNVKKMEDTHYLLDGKEVVVKAVPMYLATKKTIKDEKAYKVIKTYLTDNKMLSNSHGLNGLLGEYYAYVKELDFLIKYRNFCAKYGLKDTASVRIVEIIEACEEWRKAADEYVSFIQVNYDGYVYEELKNANTLAVLDAVNKEYASIDTTKPKSVSDESAPETVKKPDATPKVDKKNLMETRRAEEKKQFTSVWEVIVNFFETAYFEFTNWVQEFFA